MSTFDLAHGVQDGAPCLVIQGELDIATAPSLDAALTTWRADPDGGPHLVLDLREVAFMDSSGLRSVIVGARDAAQDGRRLSVLAGTGRAARLIELAGVADHLEIVDRPRTPIDD